MESYVDADWADYIQDTKYHTIAVILFKRNPVSWTSRKQDLVVASSVESEYIAFHSALSEAVFIRRLTNEVNLYADVRTRTLEDNLPTIKMNMALWGPKGKSL